jgi:general secretion pathway protein K
METAVFSISPLKRFLALSRERGIALVVVLWTLALLTVIASGFAYTTRVESTLAANSVERAQARSLAEAGIAYAALDLFRAPQWRRLRPDGSPYRWHLGGQEVVISVRDVAGLIDLNMASRDLLGGLLAAAGVIDERQRLALLDAIEDWRDPDDDPRPYGAEDKDYLAEGLPYDAKDAPFESVIELQQVLGMSPELYQRLENALTVFSEQEGIDPTVAPMEVLQAIPNVDLNMVEAYLMEREERQAVGEPPPLLPALGGGSLSEAAGLAYSVRAEAKITGGGSAVIKAVLSPNPEGQSPYSVLEWRENL